MANASPAHPTFPHLLRVFLRIGLLSFGGPAGQIALMHRELVEERPWLDEPRFLHALNFCMLLPGPEAMQLATYSGWLLRGVGGGLLAGLLFFLPGFAIIMGLSAAYFHYGDLPLVAGVLFGLKAAVLAIVLEALIKVSKRALKSRFAWVLAFAAFIGIAFVKLPFPLIVLGAPGLFADIKVSPLLASVLEFLIVWGWHLPAFHDHARANPVMLASEQVSFLLAGLLLWASVLKPREALAGAGGLFLTSMHMTLLGAILILSPRLLYQAEICRLGGIPDQQMGGMIMLAIGTPVYLIASLVLLSKELRSGRNGELTP